MRRAPEIMSAVVIVGIVALLAPAAVAGQTTPMGDVIQRINQAADASAVIAAYSDGLMLDRRFVPLHEAYLGRMIGFGHADLLSYQAQLLLALEPENGMAWAVMAYNQADEGNMTDAFASLRRAAGSRPDEPFVQNLAGQLVGWYDRQTDKSALNGRVAEDMQFFRDKMADKEPFKEGYKVAFAGLDEGADVEQDVAADLYSKPQTPLYATPATVTPTVEGQTVIYETNVYPTVSSYPYPALYPYYRFYVPTLVFISGHGHRHHRHSPFDRLVSNRLTSVGNNVVVFGRRWDSEPAGRRGDWDGRRMVAEMPTAGAGTPTVRRDVPRTPDPGLTRSLPGAAPRLSPGAPAGTTPSRPREFSRVVPRTVERSATPGQTIAPRALTPSGPNLPAIQPMAPVIGSGRPAIQRMTPPIGNERPTIQRTAPATGVAPPFMAPSVRSSSGGTRLSGVSAPAWRVSPGAAAGAGRSAGWSSGPHGPGGRGGRR